MIRLADAADTATVRSIVDSAYAPYVPRIGKKPGPMLDDYATRIEAGQVWILDQAGILVLEDGPDALLLDNIAVAPEHHGKGLGRALLIFAEQEALRRGYRAIRLYTNAMMTENIALYARGGYRETARVSEKGFDRVYMEKPLG